MDTSAIEASAALLADTQQTRQWLAELPDALSPRTLEEAYAIQDATAAASGRIHRGWKVGCTSPQTQALFGVDQPIVGHVFADRLFAGPAAVTSFRPDMPLVEAEFAFTMAHDLPPRASGHDAAAVLAAVGALHLAIEVVESRFIDWRTPRLLPSIADNASHGALVLGEPMTDWRDIDLPSIEVTLRAAGEIVARGEGRRVLGDPRHVLVWLCEFLSRRHIGMRAGEVVTTGTCIGAPVVPVGTPVVAEFGGLGRIEIVFGGSEGGGHIGRSPRKISRDAPD